jgi:ribose 5-phosphate isomerase A
VNPKQAAAEYAAALVQDGMTVGLGTGSTAAYVITALGERVRRGQLNITTIATSRASEELAQRNGIRTADWDAVRRFDISIDGADEIDPAFRMIKGGGAALLREKIVAAASVEEVIVVDDTKIKATLGAHPLPVVVAPYGWQATRDRLEHVFGCSASMRASVNGQPLTTDDGLHVLDLHFDGPLPGPDTLEQRLKAIPGVLEVGLFIGLCQRLVVGYESGSVREFLPGSNPLDPSASH